MAYSTIDKCTANFNNKLYTGNASTQAITGVGFKPDLVWIKNRSTSNSHVWTDSVRGASSTIYSNSTDAQDSSATNVGSFDTDGFTLGSNAGTNGSGNNVASWNWLAGGSSPSQTYTVKVVSDSGNKYRFDDFGTSAVTLDLQEGGTYTFDQSDSSNAGHPLRFSTTSNGTHGGGSEYTTGVTTNGTPGSSGAYTRITVAASAPTLYYYCTQHSGMGGQANTNSTHGSSNFSGTIQSTVSANSSSGFSIIKYTGSGATATIGHGLSKAPHVIIVKQYNSTRDWVVGSGELGWTKYQYLNSTQVSNTGNFFNDTAPTSSVFSVVNDSGVNGSGNSYIAYCFANTTGFSQMGWYRGSGQDQGTYITCSFKPKIVFIKNTEQGGDDWHIFDDQRSASGGGNIIKYRLFPNSNSAETTTDNMGFDFYSNGFQVTDNLGAINNFNEAIWYMAFGQTIVGSNNVAATAR